MGSPRVVGRATALHHNPKADLHLVFAHPSTSYADHFLAEALAARGVGVLNVDGRYVDDAYDLRFLDAALDVAIAVDACVPRGARTVLVGHSGGGPLMALVQTRFGVGHALVLLAAHPSRAHILHGWIDPSVRADGTRDPALDLYSREPPLDPAFLAAYRAAQTQRLVNLGREAGRHLLDGEPEARVPLRYIFAAPRFVDRKIDKNRRDPTRFPFGNPARVNAREGFMGGWVTARSFLDQWYLPTTSANGLALAPYLDVPVLHLAFGADHLVFPSHSDAWTSALPGRLTEAGVVPKALHNPRLQPRVVQRIAERMLAWLGAGG
ncbi:MAG: alpha/beta hydrolase family protein [Sandaracinaceae bacterium]